MDNSPALSFTPEYHRYPIIARRLFRLTWDAEAEMLDLHDIAEIAIRVCHNSLAGVCALRKLRANPIEPSADRFPSFFDCAAESSRKSDIVRMGPECLEGSGLAVLEFELRSINLG